MIILELQSIHAVKYLAKITLLHASNVNGSRFGFLRKRRDIKLIIFHDD